MIFGGQLKCYDYSTIYLTSNIPFSQSEDCVLSDFGEWSPCTKGCGGGSQTRTREVIRQAENNGTACGQQPMSQTRTCNVHDCAGRIYIYI